MAAGQRATLAAAAAGKVSMTVLPHQGVWTARPINRLFGEASALMGWRLFEQEALGQRLDSSTSVWHSQSRSRTTGRSSPEPTYRVFIGFDPRGLSRPVWREVYCLTPRRLQRFEKGGE